MPKTRTPYLVYELPLWDADGNFLHENYWSQPVFFCHADGSVFDSNADMLDAWIAQERGEA